LKHGIDFTAAQALWFDDDRVEIPARSTHEKRSLVVGCINEKHWSAMVTERSGRIRIISVRRSRTEEVKIYESEKNIGG
jgi:uncharacterized protein